MAETTAFTVFHPPRDAAEFDAWLAELAASAAAAPGFVSARASTHDDPRLDWGFATTFASAGELHAWLDGPRAELLTVGSERGFLRNASDLILVAGERPPAGSNVFEHSVTPGQESEFVAVQGGLAEETAAFAGYEGTGLFPGPNGTEWLALLRFRTPDHLSTWLHSPERAQALPNLRTHLTEDFRDVSLTTPFATTVRTENGETKITPDWKSAMIVLLVLYPTVMVLSRFVGPVFDRLGADPGLALFISQICSVGLMTYWSMPLVSRWFQKWLDPVEGADVRTSLTGAVIILVLYAAILAIFLSVKWLQFWDYNT